MRLVPVVQARLLERTGAATDAEGLTIVARDLTCDLCCEDHPRRWLLICADPWGYLADWITAQLVKSYKGTAGKRAPSTKELGRILAE